MLINFQFKIVYTTIVKTLAIEGNVSIADFITNINGCWRCVFADDIDNYYHLQIVVAGNFENGDAEMAPELLPLNNVKICDRFDPVTTTFYIRPVNPVTDEFVLRNFALPQADSRRPVISTPLYVEISPWDIENVDEPSQTPWDIENVDEPSSLSMEIEQNML